MRARFAVVVTLLVAAACQFGPSPRRFAPARFPAGVTVELHLGYGRVLGELIAVDEGGLFVLAHTRAERRDPRRELVHAKWELVTAAALTQAGSVRLERREPGPAERERLRLLSRFPQGLGAALTERLLASLGQTQVTELEP